MNLFYMPGASSLAGHIGLEWSGAGYEAVRMDRRSIEGEDFLALNPAGSVPLLVDGDSDVHKAFRPIFYPERYLQGGEFAPRLVLSWVDENYRGEAAMPLPNFMRYVGDGAIRLAA